MRSAGGSPLLVEALPSRGAQRSPERSSQVASRGTSKAALLSKLTLLCELRVICQQEAADALAMERGDGAAARAQHLLHLQTNIPQISQREREAALCITLTNYLLKYNTRRYEKESKKGGSGSADTRDHILLYIITFLL